MLVRLMYASRAAEAVRPETLSAILKKSTTANAKHGITGVLVFSVASLECTTKYTKHTKNGV